MCIHQFLVGRIEALKRGAAVPYAARRRRHAGCMIGSEALILNNLQVIEHARDEYLFVSVTSVIKEAVRLY